MIPSGWYQDFLSLIINNMPIKILICCKIDQTLQNIKMTSDYRPRCRGMEPVVWTYTTSNNCVMLRQPAGSHNTRIIF